ncbi:hypothetical protein ACIA8R_44770 [Nonomuraea sp. NPDC051191]|uniref:hypothetical protein n=1 Tax=Nonomuraea sp. NPDC051191 TaxID=3364372 RepID=UPI00379AAD96
MLVAGFGLQTLTDAAGLIGWQVEGDSTVCRAHQHAAAHPGTGRRRPRIPEVVELDGGRISSP